MNTKIKQGKTTWSESEEIVAELEDMGENHVLVQIGPYEVTVGEVLSYMPEIEQYYGHFDYEAALEPLFALKRVYAFGGQIYRKVFLPDIASLNKADLGRYWTLDPTFAEDLDRPLTGPLPLPFSSRRTQGYLLTAWTPPHNVQMPDDYWNNLNESEATVIDTSLLTLTRIEDATGTPVQASIFKRIGTLMQTQKDYLSSQVVRPLRQQPEAPRNIYDLADKQQQVTAFTAGDESGLTDTLNVPDEVIPEVRQSQAPRNRFVDKMQDQFDAERADEELLEGADPLDDEPKPEQHAVSQPQPGPANGGDGASHHGSKKQAAKDITAGLQYQKFTFVCRGCGQTLQFGSVSPKGRWLSDGVAIEPNDRIHTGFYDGHGVLAAPGYRIVEDRDDCWHQRCWAEAGNPGYESAAKIIIEAPDIQGSKKQAGSANQYGWKPRDGTDAAPALTEAQQEKLVADGHGRVLCSCGEYIRSCKCSSKCHPYFEVVTGEKCTACSQAAKTSTLARTVLKASFNPRRIGRVINYDDGIRGLGR